jgi:hypothetical protein
MLPHLRSSILKACKLGRIAMHQVPHIIFTTWLLGTGKVFLGNFWDLHF